MVVLLHLFSFPLITLLSLLFVEPTAGSLCPRGEDDHMSLCAMCSDSSAAVRWNTSDSVRLILRMVYTCEGPDDNGTTPQVLESKHDPCFESSPSLSESDTYIAAVGSEVTAGTRCKFTMLYQVRIPVHDNYRIYPAIIKTDCTIKSRESCESSPESCHIDQTCEADTRNGTCAGCHCTDGYGGNGCTNVNECGANITCHEYAECHDTEGSYWCECRAGFQGDGYNCTDVNECEARSGGCHENAECVNNVGSFTCQCNPGYTGDGHHCSHFQGPSTSCLS